MSAPAPQPRLGIFARTFVRDTAEQVAQAVADHGFDLTQLNLSSMGGPTLPPLDDQPDYPAIGSAFAAAGVQIWGLSATYNVIHPDIRKRAADTAKAVTLIERAGRLGVTAVTLCTGTRDPDNMWKAHPDNTSAAAWSDLLHTMAVLIPAARAAGITLGVEPEGGNVIRNADAATRLLDDLGADAEVIGIILDPANLLTPGTLPQQHRILGDAFTHLGPAVTCLHAKDVVAQGEYSAAGQGGLDYDFILGLHRELPHQVPVIIQDSTESDVARTRQFLLDHAAR
jgi:sugar phosphate isomerase/epimerase